MFFNCFLRMLFKSKILQHYFSSASAVFKETEAVIQEKMFWNYAASLQEKTHTEMRFQ